AEPATVTGTVLPPAACLDQAGSVRARTTDGALSVGRLGPGGSCSGTSSSDRCGGDCCRSPGFCFSRGSVWQFDHQESETITRKNTSMRSITHPIEFEVSKISSSRLLRKWG